MAFTINGLSAARKIYLKHGLVACESQKDPTAPLFNEFRTKQAFELIQNATGFGFATLRAELGASIEQNRRVLYEVTVTPVNYTLKWKESWESRDFDQYSTVSKNAMLAGVSIKATEIRARANILNNGFSTAGPDGVSLFNSAHPTNGGPTYSNITTAAALSEESLLLAVQQQRALADPDGKKMRMDIDYHLVHPTNLIGQVKKMEKSLLNPTTANNDVNVGKEFFSGLCVEDLTDTNAWFLFPKDKSKHTVSIMYRKPQYLNMMEDVEGDVEIVTGKEWALFWEHGYGPLGNEGA